MEASLPVTRSRSTVWLVGEPIAHITGNKLPSNGDVIRRFFFLHRIENKTIKEAASDVSADIAIFWKKARIPTKDKQHVISKVQNLFVEWRKLLKGKSRRSQPQIKKEHLFVQKLDNLFDITHADAMQLIKIEEDKLFLQAQREKGHRGFMAGEDTVLAGVEECRLKQEAAREMAVEKEKQKLTTTTSVVDISSDSETTEAEDTATNVSEVDTEHHNKCSCHSSVNIVTSQLAAALDHTKTTSRNAVYLLSETAVSLGRQPSDLAINRETIHRMRIKWRTQAAKYIRESFSPNVPLIVHWDSKLMPDLDGSDKVDRLAIIVSGENTSKLLNVPKLQSGTGCEMAQAMYDCLQEWNISNQIQGFSFDMTASNTGKKMGPVNYCSKNLAAIYFSLHAAIMFLRLLQPKCSVNASRSHPAVLIFHCSRDLKISGIN